MYPGHFDHTRSYACGNVRKANGTFALCAVRAVIYWNNRGSKTHTRDVFPSSRLLRVWCVLRYRASHPHKVGQASFTKLRF